MDPAAQENHATPAAELTGRVCFMSELDPKYADQILRRWEQATKQKAVKA